MKRKANEDTKEAEAPTTTAVVPKLDTPKAGPITIDSKLGQFNISFHGLSALVTGAGKGIGRQICIDLAKCGAFVVAVSRTEADLILLKKELDGFGVGCKIITADIEKPEEAKRIAKEAGDVDLLVNNAGIARLGAFLELSVEDWDATLNVNLRASFIVAQIVAKGMAARGRGGSIVNVSSQASSVGLEKHVAYCASKGGMDQLTRVMALELGKHNIRVNSVNPTVVLTDMGTLVWSAPEVSTPMLAKIPLGRFAQPCEVSSVVLFLLSPMASMITGITLPVDGGFLSSK